MDQLNIDLAAVDTAVAAVKADVAAIAATPAPTTSTDPNDAVVAAFVSSLTADGWTVTAPVAPATPAEIQGAPVPELPADETPAEDATDLPTEA